ncbi:MAG: hypothetical protein ABW040_04605 [Microbacteriaceae bacterium]
MSGLTVDRRAGRRAGGAVALTALTSLALVAAPITPAFAEPSSSFADAALESCVRGALEIGPDAAITAEELAALTELVCADAGVGSVADLAGATSLLTLDISGNRLVDLSPLAALPAEARIDASAQEVVLDGVSTGNVVTVPSIVGRDAQIIALESDAAAEVAAIVDGTSATWDCTGSGVLSWTSGGDAATFSGRLVADVAYSGVAPCDIPDLAVPVVSGEARVGSTVAVSRPDWGVYASGDIEWRRAGELVDGATGDTYAVGVEDIDALLTAGITAHRTGYTDRVITAAAVGPVQLGAITTSAPVISGTAKVGSTLTAAAGSWSPQPVAPTFQWSRSGVPIPDATEATYALVTADAGHRITVTATGDVRGYAAASATSAPTVVVTGGALTAPTPVISGAPRAGSVLTAKPGVWGPGAVTLTYQWKRNGAAIAGATKSTYTVAKGDAATKITVTVTGTRTGFTTASTTSAALTVERALTATPRPTVSGTARVGSTLTAKPGTWSPAPVTLKYQWSRGGTAIPGATKATYKLVTADAGAKITVRVTGSRSGYTSVGVTSAALTVEKLFTAPVPTVSGTARVGSVLTAKPGTWTPAASKLTYQWKRNGAAITGATKATYTLVTADAGRNITVTVTGTRSGYTPASRTSANRAVEKLLTATPVPKITGTVSTGSRLTATPGTWKPAPVTLTYQWQRNGTAIAGATKATYVLTGNDIGKKITVVVRGTKTGYTPVSKKSAATAAVTQAIAIKGDGAYRVGSGLKPGVYVTKTQTTGCYWEVVSDFSGHPDSVVQWDFGTGQRIVEILSEDWGFVTVGCGAWVRLSDVPAAPKSAIAGDGEFAIGIHLRPGLYKADRNVSNCYWSTLAGFSEENFDLLDGAWVYSGRPTVRIDSWVTGFESYGCGSWTRVGN